jgi:uncharacterized membrane protein
MHAAISNLKIRLQQNILLIAFIPGLVSPVDAI